MSQKIEDLLDGFNAGNCANDETENLNEALNSALEDGPRTQAWQTGFVLGFFSVYELDQIPEEYRGDYDSAYWSRNGRTLVRLVPSESRDDEYE